MTQRAPNYIKYSTRNNNHYVYDALSGQIIRVGIDAYELLDDYVVLSEEKFYAKCYERGFSEEVIHSVVAGYKSVHIQGISVAQKFSTKNLYPHKIFYDGQIFSCEEFFKKILDCLFSKLLSGVIYGAGIAVMVMTILLLEVIRERR